MSIHDRLVVWAVSYRREVTGRSVSVSGVWNTAAPLSTVPGNLQVI